MPVTGGAQPEAVVGQAMVGGPFQLIDHDGKPFSDRDLRGSWALLYFGFTSCPDICPDELDKMTEALNMMGACQVVRVSASYPDQVDICESDAGALLVMRCRIPLRAWCCSKADPVSMIITMLQCAGKDSSAAIQPVFISVDPERDSVPQVRRYIKEFHPRLIGLTGSAEQVSPDSARAGVGASGLLPPRATNMLQLTGQGGS